MLSEAYGDPMTVNGLDSYANMYGCGPYWLKVVNGWCPWQSSLRSPNPLAAIWFLVFEPFAHHCEAPMLSIPNLVRVWKSDTLGHLRSRQLVVLDPASPKSR